MYEALDLTITDSTGETIFIGKISEFEKLNGRDLASGKTEQLEFTVKFPEELGNDYQGLMTHLNWIFTLFSI